MVPHTNAYRSHTLSCEHVQAQLAALAEGTLTSLTMFRLMEHVRQCGACQSELTSFRQFISVEVPQAVLTAALQPEEATPPAAMPPRPPFWQQWQDRVQQWLDSVFPATLVPAYRSGSTGSASWELNARKKAETPFFEARQEGTEVIAHVARGFMFGRIGGHSGEPRYPVVLQLHGGPSQQQVLNQPDGTFLLRWDPDATELRCQSPSGALSCFALPT